MQSAFNPAALGMPQGAAPPKEQAPPDDGKLKDLSVKIDKKACYARNVSPQHPMSNLFIGDSKLGCKSDADEQLLLHVAFNEFVKVHSVKFTAFNSGASPEQNPTIIKLFVNRESMGFEDCDDIVPTQELELTEEELMENGEAVLLKYVKFQRVRSITLFIEDNAGGDITSLGMLKFYGRPVAGTNMNDFKKQG